MQELLFIISILPVALIAFYIYKKDKNKEPAKLLLKLFIAGLLSTILVIIISEIMSAVFPIMNENTNNLTLIQLLFYVFIGVATIEECCKWIMTYKIAYNDKNFDEFYDMIEYAVFVSLGFACLENLLYVSQSSISVGLFRAVLAVPGHACDGIFMGYYLGLAKLSEVNNNKKLKKKNLILSILVPILLHGIYDYCLLSGNNILIIAFFIFIIILYRLAIQKIKKISKINSKFKYKDKYCPNCGHIVESNFCLICGRKNN